MRQHKKLLDVKIKDVLPHIKLKNKWEKPKKTYIKLGDYTVGVSSLRLYTFKDKGTICANCGMKGRYFSVDREEDGIPYLNLYGLKGDTEILFVRDGIIPSSKGGVQNLANSQTLCFECSKNKLENIK